MAAASLIYGFQWLLAGWRTRSLLTRGTQRKNLPICRLEDVYVLNKQAQYKRFFAIAKRTYNNRITAPNYTGIDAQKPKPPPPNIISNACGWMFTEMGEKEAKNG